jgi:hypothetical protein
LGAIAHTTLGIKYKILTGDISDDNVKMLNPEIEFILSI